MELEEELNPKLSLESSPPNPDDILDICFLLDTTGSMGPYISLMRKCLKDLAYYFSSTFSPKKVYMSFVGYRDFGDKDQFTCVDFVQLDINNFLESDFYKKINGLTMSGGGDLAEDIRGAIKKSLTFKWRSVNKFVILIADAPTHGRRYCNEGDDFPDEDIQDVIDELMKRKIGFFGVEFCDLTKMMYEELKNIYKDKGLENYFALEDMKELMKEKNNNEEMALRFMDLIATKVKSTMFKIFKLNKILIL